MTKGLLQVTEETICRATEALAYHVFRKVKDVVIVYSNEVIKNNRKADISKGIIVASPVNYAHIFFSALENGELCLVSHGVGEQSEVSGVDLLNEVEVAVVS